MRKIFSLFTMAVIFTVFSFQISAQPAVNFSVKAEIPDNQIDKSKTYFDLKMEPGAEQTIKVRITNTGDKEITATCMLNPATTGQNGLILYDVPSSGISWNQKSVTEITHVETPRLRIEAGGSAVAEIKINMPKENFEGILLGGLVFKAEHEKSDKKEVNNDTEILFQNEIEYIIALKITQDNKEVAPNFTLLGVEAGQENHRTAVLATIENTRPAIVKGMNIEGEIYKKDSSEIFKKISLSDAEAAPNSSFPLVFDWENTRIEEGDYLLKLNVTHAGEEWNFNREFTIDNRQAHTSNQGAVNLPARSINVWLFSAITVAVVALIVVLWVAFARSKRRYDDI